MNSPAAYQEQAKPSPLLILALLLTFLGPTLTFVVLPAALPLIATSFGGGARGQAVAQLVQVLPFFGLAAGGLIAGPIIARLGMMTALIAAATAFALGGLGGMLAGSVIILYPSSLLIGLSGAVLTAALAAATATVFGSSSARIKMLSFQTATSDVLAVCAGFASALVAQFYGWHGCFAIYTGYGLILLVLIVITRPESVEINPEERHTDGGLIKATKLTWPVLLGGTFVPGVAATQTTLLPFHLAEHGLVTPSSRAVVLVLVTLSAMASSIFCAVMRDRLSERTLYSISAASGTLGFIGYFSWNGGMPLVLASAIAGGFGWGLNVPLLLGDALRRTPAALHGYSIGLLNTFIYVGSFMSPFVFGIVRNFVGMSGMFLVCAALTASAFVLLASGLLPLVPPDNGRAE